MHGTEPQTVPFNAEQKRPGTDRAGARVCSVADRRQSSCQLCQWTPERSGCSIHDAPEL